MVLHDGAPNVGTAWTVDEYSQGILFCGLLIVISRSMSEGFRVSHRVFAKRWLVYHEGL